MGPAQEKAPASVYLLTKWDPGCFQDQTPGIPPSQLACPASAAGSARRDAALSRQRGAPSAKLCPAVGLEHGRDGDQSCETGLVPAREENRREPLVIAANCSSSFLFRVFI